MNEKNDLKNYLQFLQNQPKGFVFADHALPKSNPATKPVLNLGKADELKKLYSQYTSCQGCPLAKLGRSQVVCGVGNPDSPLVFVGEAPGRDEDKLGAPFVGRAGQLLTKIIEAMGYSREAIFITNVAKCRPPENRTPLPEEREKCKSSILLKELEIIKPKIICALGSCATQGLLGDEIKISQSRGKFFDWNGYLVLPTYHPAYLLRNPAEKRTVWEDMKVIMAKLKELGV